MRQVSAVLLSVLFVGLGVSFLVSGADVPPGFGDGGAFVCGLGAPAIALGGAFIALADGASGSYWNPAGTGHVKGYHVGGMYVPGVMSNVADLDDAFQSVSLSATPVQTGSLSGLGIGITWANYTLSGTLDERGGVLSDSDSRFLLSLSWVFGIRDWSLATGSNVKYYKRVTRAGEMAASADGFGFDVGVLLHGSVADNPISFGLVSLDTFETTLKWHGTPGEPLIYLPWVIKGGVAISFFDAVFKVSSDLEYSISHLHDNTPMRTGFDFFHLGIEIALVPQFVLRTGIILSLGGRTSLSAGVGLKPWENITVDYAYVHGGGGGGLSTDKHVFSAEFSIP